MVDPKDTRLSIDMYAILAKRKADIDKQMKSLRPFIEALGEGTHEGINHAVVVTKVSSTSLSVALAKTFLTPLEILASTTTSESIRVTIDH